jgi:hypothetical protein
MTTDNLLHIEKFPWNRVTDFYYDHVRWATGLGLYQWIQREFGATMCLNTQALKFDTEEQKSWFLLRWA